MVKHQDSKSTQLAQNKLRTGQAQTLLHLFPWQGSKESIKMLSGTKVMIQMMQIWDLKRKLRSLWTSWHCSGTKMMKMWTQEFFSSQIYSCQIPKKGGIWWKIIIKTSLIPSYNLIMNMQDKKNVISRRTTRHAWPCTLTKQSICPWTCSWKTSSICRAAQNKVQQRKQSKIQITSLFLVNNKPNLIKMLRRLYQREKERLALILSSFVNRLSSANQRSRMNKSFQIWMDQLRLILSANLL